MAETTNLILKPTTPAQTTTTTTITASTIITAIPTTATATAKRARTQLLQETRIRRRDPLKENPRNLSNLAPDLRIPDPEADPEAEPEAEPEVEEEAAEPEEEEEEDPEIRISFLRPIRLRMRPNKINLDLPKVRFIGLSDFFFLG